MNNIEKLIDLETNTSTEKLSLDFKYIVQDYFTLQASVISNGFSGTSHFCFSKIDINAFRISLLSLYDTLAGQAKLLDRDSDGYIEFRMNSNGKLSVLGQIGGTHNIQYLKFAFITDQTVLPKLIDELKILNEYEDIT